jgi:hypothetical protein
MATHGYGAPKVPTHSKRSSISNAPGMTILYILVLSNGSYTITHANDAWPIQDDVSFQFAAGTYTPTAYELLATLSYVYTWGL